MILVDSNVLMYAVGADHSNKAPAIHVLRRVAEGDLEATIDAEILQEILHRYRSLHRWPEGKEVYALARRLFPDVLAITGVVMDHARQLADEDSAVSARDAVHAGVVATYKLEGICSFDRDFDRIQGCRRIGLVVG
jgi:hypothetical protein